MIGRNYAPEEGVAVYARIFNTHPGCTYRHSDEKAA